MNAITAVESRLVAAAIVSGCAALLLRPPLMMRFGGTPLVLVLFGALLVIGVSAPLGPLASMRPSNDVIAVVVIGCAAFFAGRLLVDGDAVAAALPRIVGLNTLAAVAEEAFFRRLVYGALLPRGATVAVFGSATLFAVVHVTVYGWWVLPIDLVAGLVFSWQRWSSGSWVAPAITHSFANLLAVL